MKIIFRITALLMLAAMLLSLGACASGNEALAALPSLIERAEVLNEYIWGKGPEVEFYDDGGISSSSSKYVRVVPSAEYSTLSELTEAILQVYSNDYCEIIFEIVMTGSEETFARYNEDDTGRLTLDVVNKGFELRTVLDASQAKVKSTGFNRVVVTMPCTFDGQPDGNYDVTMVWENGTWKLDSPTY